jgi:hypothetical protein
MRRIAMGLLCCTLGTLPAVAGAAEINCVARAYIPPQGAYGITGAYALSNGDTLRVSREGTRFFANMGNTGRVEIVPLDDDDFAERGGPLRFGFDRDVATGAGVAVAGLDAQRPATAACPERPGLPCYGPSCPR